MDIKTIKKSFELYKKLANVEYVPILKLSKEINVKGVELMEFIENNPDFFDVSPKCEYKNGNISKNLGLCISNVFSDASENPSTDEWLNKKIEDCNKYIHINEALNYGHVEGYYIEIDTKKNSRNREYIWRNTSEKIESIKDYLFRNTFYIGGYGDCSGYEQEYAIEVSSIKLLKEKGWQFNEIKSLEK